MFILLMKIIIINIQYALYNYAGMYSSNLSSPSFLIPIHCL